ncbi:MAG TPA: hypothetical protein ENH11_00490 [Candidatus Acetothermia bacterium]|nr:hypothetical protein [Candidatus Acetothermia bacterium]
MKAVLSFAFGGVHNAPHPKVSEEFEDTWEVYYPQELATVEADVLTKLVAAAHVYCVRVSISAWTGSSVKIVLSPRQLRDTHPHAEDLVMMCDDIQFLYRCGACHWEGRLVDLGSAVGRLCPRCAGPCDEIPKQFSGEDE